MLAQHSSSQASRSITSRSGTMDRLRPCKVNPRLNRVRILFAHIEYPSQNSSRASLRASVGGQRQVPDGKQWQRREMNSLRCGRLVDDCWTARPGLLPGDVSCSSARVAATVAYRAVRQHAITALYSDTCGRRAWCGMCRISKADYRGLGHAD